MVQQPSAVQSLFSPYEAANQKQDEAPAFSAAVSSSGLSVVKPVVRTKPSVQPAWQGKKIQPYNIDILLTRSSPHKGTVIAGITSKLIT